MKAALVFRLLRITRAYLGTDCRCGGEVFQTFVTPYVVRRCGRCQSTERLAPLAVLALRKNAGVRA